MPGPATWENEVFAILGIDREICINCGECMAECPSQLYAKDGEGFGFLADQGFSCSRCGHCVAVCPTDAVRYESPERAVDLDSLREDSGESAYRQILYHIRERRSIRRFQDRRVSDEDVAAVLDAARYAPSASNAQNWEYIVITNRDLIKTLSLAACKMLAAARFAVRLRWIISPFVSGHMRSQLLKPGTRRSLDNFNRDIKSGEDPIFFLAPCVIVLHSPSYGHLAGNDAGIALTCAMLSATARGLGSCWIGFVEELFIRFPRWRRRLGIPKGHQVRGVLAIGHPSMQYHRVPPRNPLRVRYIS